LVTATDGNTINNAGLLQGGKQFHRMSWRPNKNQILPIAGRFVSAALVGFIGFKLTGEGNFVNNSGFIGGAKAVVPDERDRGQQVVVNYGTLQGVKAGPAIDSTASGGNLVVTDDGDIIGNSASGWGTTR